MPLIFRNYRFSHPGQAFLLVSLLLCLLMAAGCSGPYRDDSRLRRAEEVLADPELPQERAIEMLDTLRAIPGRELSEGERHFRSFLMIKASDKGYISHTSDSLYLTVKDYFSSRHREMLPEVLYYGGRIYSDMGVYPLALEHFEGVLDCLGDNPTDLRLKRRVLSQTGRLLSQLRVHDQGLKYVEECLEIGEILDDTLIQVYNLELAGDISTRLKDFFSARKYFEEACRLSKGKYPGEYAINRFRVGDVAFDEGDTLSALRLMGSTIKHISGMSRNYALPVAAQAYLKAGILDTAYIYAKELVTSPDPLNKEFGYRVLTSPGIRETLPPDTLAEYLFRYDDILGQQRDANMEEAAIIQNSLYNYDVHDRARQIAEKERDSLELWLALAVALASGLGLMIVLPMLKKEKRLNKISRLVAKRDILRSMFPSGGSASTQHGSDGKSPVSTGETLLTEVANMSINEGREKLREEMLRLCELNRTNGLDYLVPERISSSPAYIEIRERISSGKKIDEDDPLWREIEKVVSACFPDFRRRLHLLSEGKLTVAEERTAMLVKCGFGATDMGKAFGRVKGTMVTRRASISRKIFDEVKGSHLVDELIRVL